MRNIFLLFIAIVFFSCGQQKIQIASFSETGVGVYAADELNKYLGQMYSGVKFETCGANSKAVIQLLLTEQARDLVIQALPTQKECFKIIQNEGKLLIISPDERGLLNATYALLEKLGCGFYISGEAIPKTKKWTGLNGWETEDRPLTNQRIVFNWHNFLSGCSSWDFEDWKHYIDQSSKMKFNGLMTHFYANDPTFIFSHNGVEKTAGFMPNTQKGRQYGTQQVNDVRRLPGGYVFEDAVFGSKSSKVADENRVAEARKLMQNVHEYASSKYMDIWFGLDIDAELANPQEIMATLPESAKIKVLQKSDKYFGTPDSVFYLPIPDSPDGFSYYKSMITQLFQQFPETDNIVLWTRTSGSPFLTLKYDSFPENWKSEFNRIAASNNKIDKNNIDITGRFATAKIYTTVRKILDESNRKEIKLWAGSWRTTWLEQANWFYPREVGFIPLDYHVDYFNVDEKYEILKEISKNREIIPVVWAHHDDGAFIGSPYVPYENLQTKVESVGNPGIGVIHWTTKPLDIYFKNTEQQFWASTANASLKSTSDFMAERWVDEAEKKTFSQYLEYWVKEGPKFGRETRTWFIDHQISADDYRNTIQGCETRLEMLLKMDVQNNPQIQYFKGLEEFCIDFYATQFNYQEALNACKSGNYKKAQNLISACYPEKVIEKYAEISKLNGITKGEKGVIIEMNLSWVPLINSLRQTLRVHADYLNFGTVNFPDLGVGLLNTNFIIDSENRLWRTLGEEETRGEIVQVKTDNLKSYHNYRNEIINEGIFLDELFDIDLKPFAVDISPGALKNPEFYIPGNYKVNLILSAMEKCSIAVQIEGKEGLEMLFDGEITLEQNDVVTKTFPVQLHSTDGIKIRVKNLNGSCFLNGVIVEPVKL
jgi:hypothetical protein